MRKIPGLLLFILVAAASLIVGMPHAFADAVKYEAEAAKLINNPATADAAPGFSGAGYVDGFQATGDAVEFTVNASAGLYAVTIGYAAPYGRKTNDLYVNGAFLGSVVFPETTAFTEVYGGKAYLKEGPNTIAVSHNWGWFQLDYIAIESAAAAPIPKVSNKLVNPDASIEAKRLMTYLADVYGTKMLSGQQEYSNTSEAQWLLANTGEKPAVLGLDMIDYSPSRVERGTVSTDVEKAIAYDAEGGIVTFAWHWNAPKDLVNVSGKEWWRGFYADSTTFDLAYALSQKDSEDYLLLIRDIDAIAQQLKRLQAAGVPVLWRPLHEAEGGWFWWGVKGPEPCKQLYILMYERLTSYHKINNLIWVWNSTSPDWYPGDQYVDIVSFDSYPAPKEYGPQAGAFEALHTLVAGKKLVAMSENGPIPDPEQVLNYNVPWSWFCTWYGAFITDGYQNTLDHVKAVYNSEYVITLDELPDLKNYPLDGGAGETGQSPVTPPEPPQEEPPDETPAAEYSISYAIRNGSGGNAIVQVSITNNTSKTINGWRLAFTFPGDQVISSLRRGDFVQNGADVTVTNSRWNGVIRPGRKVSFGFNLRYSGTNAAPTAFTLNGVQIQ